MSLLSAQEAILGCVGTRLQHNAAQDASMDDFAAVAHVMYDDCAKPGGESKTRRGRNPPCKQGRVLFSVDGAADHGRT